MDRGIKKTYLFFKYAHSNKNSYFFIISLEYI